jgi:hypothetical protein
VGSALRTELEDTSNVSPAHVASLLVISLFASFLFSNSVSTITWDFINVACKIKDVNAYNWSLIVLQFLEKGLSKYNKDKPVTLSGCLLLILVSIQNFTDINNFYSDRLFTWKLFIDVNNLLNTINFFCSTGSLITQKRKGALQGERMQNIHS